MKRYELWMVAFLTVSAPASALAAEHTANLAAHPAAWIALVAIALFRVFCCFVESDCAFPGDDEGWSGDGPSIRSRT